MASSASGVGGGGGTSTFVVIIASSELSENSGVSRRDSLGSFTLRFETFETLDEPEYCGGRRFAADGEGAFDSTKFNGRPAFDREWSEGEGSSSVEGSDSVEGSSSDK